VASSFEAAAQGQGHALRKGHPTAAILPASLPSSAANGPPDNGAGTAVRSGTFGAAAQTSQQRLSPHTAPTSWQEADPFVLSAQARISCEVAAAAADGPDQPLAGDTPTGGASASESQTSGRLKTGSLRIVAGAAHAAQATVAGVQRLVQRQLLVAAAAAASGEFTTATYAYANAIDQGGNYSMFTSGNKTV